MSRRSDHKDIPTAEQTMISPERFIGFKADIGDDIISLIREAQQDDESMETLIKSTRDKNSLPPSIRKQYDKYEWQEDLLWYDGRIIIPNDSEIRLKLLEMFHDNPIAGHQGVIRTLELVSNEYYWSGMKNTVKNFVDSCEVCQRSKGHKQTIPQKNTELPTRPWEEINYDFIVKLPLSNGFDSILVVVDRFSRQAHFIPCMESTNAEELAEIFIREVWKHHGLPKRTISDRGSTFNSHFLRALYQKLDIDPTFSTAYHPQTNGLAERTNQWLEGYLRSFCNYQQDDWAKWLPIAEFCHNNHVNSATGKSAFETIYGLNPKWNMTGVETNVPEANQMEAYMHEIWDEVQASMRYHQQAEEELRLEYNLGDKVYLITSNIKTKRPAKKLDSKKIGPFTITEKISSHAYRLELPTTMKIHNVFHINLLTPFKEDSEFHRRQVKPPPIITDSGEEEYEVERIISWEMRQKGKSRGLYYQVRWKGYGPEEDTMERAEKIAELSDIMTQFLAENPSAPVPKGYKRPTTTAIKEVAKIATIDIGFTSSTQPHQLPQQPQASTTASNSLNSKQWSHTAEPATHPPCHLDRQTTCLPSPNTAPPLPSPPLAIPPSPSTKRLENVDVTSKAPRIGTSSSPTASLSKLTPAPSSNTSPSRRGGRAGGASQGGDGVPLGTSSATL